MPDDKWRLQFRDDQIEFIVASLDYIISRAGERLGVTPAKPFEEFMAKTTIDRAIEIRSYIVEHTT
jgi:hypothetical protein